jgi:BASS family bile acid:Na+ symporter
VPEKNALKYFGFVFLASALAILFMLVFGYRSKVGPLVIVLFASLALYCTGRSFLKSFAFTIWVFTFVSASMFYPAAFGKWFGADLKVLIVPLIQIITFGMGTTLSVKDFSRVFVMPVPVLIGLFLQFTIMPLVGFSIATLFGFEREVAAGVILIGSVSGGVASNLITFLARGNVALSVTMTAFSTLASPVMTPFLMKSLAGRLVHVDFLLMMFSIFNMIIVPIIAGLVANKILFSAKNWANQARSLAFISGLSFFLAAAAVFVPSDFLGPLASLKGGTILGLALIGIVALAKLIVNIVLKGPKNWMDKALPLVSMSGICLIIAIITARSRNELLTVGLTLLLAVMLHNGIGYLLGYWAARVFKLDETSCRTISIEVGMQNGGMATGLAMEVLKSTSAALAPAIFGPWMNISGSVLANWWRRKSVLRAKK